MKGAPAAAMVAALTVGAQTAQTAQSAPPEPPVHLLVLGTSLSHAETWPRAFADRLAACMGREVALEVIARPGATSEWGAAAVTARAGPAPDIALVEFGVNDADRIDGLSAERSRAAHDTILAALRPTRVWVMRMNPAFGPRGWTRIGRTAREDMLFEQATVAGVGALDLTPYWRDRWADRADRRADIPDGLHPRPEAATAVIVPALIERIAPGCRDD